MLGVYDTQSFEAKWHDVVTIFWIISRDAANLCIVEDSMETTNIFPTTRQIEMNTVHFDLAEDSASLSTVVACGERRLYGSSGTLDPSAVTCRRCQRTKAYREAVK